MVDRRVGDCFIDDARDKGALRIAVSENDVDDLRLGHRRLDIDGT
jgi:hypothetical protein